MKTYINIQRDLCTDGGWNHVYIPQPKRKTVNRLEFIVPYSRSKMHQFIGIYISIFIIFGVAAAKHANLYAWTISFILFNVLFFMKFYDR